MTMRIIQITDTHIQSDSEASFYGVDSAATLASVLAEVVKLSPDLLLLTGDLVHDEGELAYQRLLSLLQVVDCPIRCLAGNHDDVVIMNQVLNGQSISCDPVFNLGVWDCLLVDSSQTGKISGYVDRQQLTQLKNRIEATTGFVLMALHHPLLPCGCEWLDKGLLLENAEQLSELIRLYPQLRLVVTGHIHQSFSQSHAGIVHLSTPSSSVQFLPQSKEFVLDEQTAPGFRVLDLHDDGQFDTRVVFLPE